MPVRRRRGSDHPPRGPRSRTGAVPAQRVEQTDALVRALFVPAVQATRGELVLEPLVQRLKAVLDDAKTSGHLRADVELDTVEYEAVASWMAAAVWTPRVGAARALMHARTALSALLERIVEDAARPAVDAQRVQLFVGDDNRLAPRRDDAAADGDAEDERMRALLGCQQGIAFEFDADGRYLSVWTKRDALLAARKEDMLGRRIDEVLGPAQGKPFHDAIDRVLQSGVAETMEYALDVPAGRRWFLADVVFIPPSGGCPPTAGLVVRDVTNLKASGAWQLGRDAVRAIAVSIDLDLDVVVAALERAAAVDPSLRTALDRARAARLTARDLRG